VALNGNYTGAIIFTGFMYTGAAVSLWLVRTWKIGELEKQAAIDGEGKGDGNGAVGKEFKRSAFLKRMFAWRKV
jgi:hypothetical protein